METMIRRKAIYRADAEAATPASYQLILTIAAMYGSSIFKIDIKAAFM